MASKSALLIVDMQNDFVRQGAPIAADSCILATAADAHMNHVEAIVARDCVAAQTAVRKRQALAVMKTAMEIDVRDARSIRA